MFVPNLYTLKYGSDLYGLHKFQDGVLMVALQHRSGDWMTVLRPTEAMLKHFEQYGVKVVAA